jgi:23S rRNA G2069 N7-methylase RlmK/C1962 C5-methylase RlmI
MIICKYLKPTDSSGAKFKLSTSDFGPFNRNKVKSKVFNYSYDYDNATSDAQKVIEAAGLTIVAKNSNHNSMDVFICKWNDEEFHKLGKLFNVETEV